MAYKKSNPNGQANMANSAPVVLASDQSTLPVSVSGSVSVSNQPTQPLTDAQLRATSVPVNTGLTELALPASQVNDLKTTSIDNYPSDYPLPTDQVTTLTPQTNALTDAELRDTPVDVDTGLTPLTDTELRASAVPVSLASAPLPTGGATAAKQLPNNHQVTVSNLPGTQPISATGLPLPSGAATAAKQLADNHNVTVSNQVSQPLTDTQLRATAVPVDTGLTPQTDALTNTQLRATPISTTESNPITGYATSANQLPDNHNVTVSNQIPAVETGLAKEAGQDPLASYKIADEDGATTTKYYGFTKTDGTWIILRQIVGTTNSYRYANVSNNTAIAYGTAGTGAWATRADLTYNLLYSLTGI